MRMLTAAADKTLSATSECAGMERAREWQRALFDRGFLASVQALPAFFLPPRPGDPMTKGPNAPGKRVSVKNLINTERL